VSGLYGVWANLPLCARAAVRSVRRGSASGTEVGKAALLGAAFFALPFGTEALVGRLDE
jgi:hypothetical protein